MESLLSKIISQTKEIEPSVDEEILNLKLSSPDVTTTYYAQLTNENTHQLYNKYIVQ